MLIRNFYIMYMLEYFLCVRNKRTTYSLKKEFIIMRSFYITSLSGFKSVRFGYKELKLILTATNISSQMKNTTIR